MHEPIVVPLWAYRFASISFQVNFLLCITIVYRFICWRRKPFQCCPLDHIRWLRAHSKQFIYGFSIKIRKWEEVGKKALADYDYNSIWRVLIEWETDKRRVAVDLNIDENDWFDLILCRVFFLSCNRIVSMRFESNCGRYFVFGQIAPCFAISKFNQQEIQIISAPLKTHT